LFSPAFSDIFTTLKNAVKNPDIDLFETKAFHYSIPIYCNSSSSKVDSMCNWLTSFMNIGLTFGEVSFILVESYLLVSSRKINSEFFYPKFKLSRTKRIDVAYIDGTNFTKLNTVLQTC